MKFIKNHKLKIFFTLVIILIIVFNGISCAKSINIKMTNVEDYVKWYQSIDIKKCLEFIYYICTPMVVFVGIDQLNDFRLDNKIRDERQSIKLAIDLCECFKNKIMLKAESIRNLQSKLPIYEKIKSQNFQFYNFAELNEMLETEEYRKILKNFFNNDENKMLINECNSLLNELELFAMSFVKEIADEEIAFPTLQAVYIRFVETCYPIICVSNIDSTDHYYTNVVSLYSIWKKRRYEYIAEREILEFNQEQEIQKLKSEKKEERKKFTEKKINGKKVTKRH